MSGFDALARGVGGPNCGVAVEKEEVSGGVELQDCLFSDGGVSIYIYGDD